MRHGPHETPRIGQSVVSRHVHTPLPCSCRDQMATDLRPLCAARPALRGCHPLGLAAREHSDSRPAGLTYLGPTLAVKDLLLPISHEDGCWSRGGQVSPCKDCGPASVSLELDEYVRLGASEASSV